MRNNIKYKNHTEPHNLDNNDTNIKTLKINIDNNVNSNIKTLKINIDNNTKLTNVTSHYKHLKTLILCLCDNNNTTKNLSVILDGELMVKHLIVMTKLPLFCQYDLIIKNKNNNYNTVETLTMYLKSKINIKGCKLMPKLKLISIYGYLYSHTQEIVIDGNFKNNYAISGFRDAIMSNAINNAYKPCHFYTANKHIKTFNMMKSSSKTQLSLLEINSQVPLNCMRFNFKFDQLLSFRFYSDMIMYRRAQSEINEKLVMENIWKMTNLRELKISNVQTFTNDNVLCVYNLIKLEKLHFLYCNIENITFKIKNLVDLKQLFFFSNNEIFCDLPNEIFYLTKLNYLHFENCNQNIFKNKVFCDLLHSINIPFKKFTFTIKVDIIGDEYCDFHKQFLLSYSKIFNIDSIIKNNSVLDFNRYCSLIVKFNGYQ